MGVPEGGQQCCGPSVRQADLTRNIGEGVEKKPVMPEDYAKRSDVAGKKEIRVTEDGGG